MNCREFQRRMPELLDRNPDPAATEDLRRHADACPRCAAELDAALRALSAATPALTLKASPGLKERTMRQILELDSQPAAARPAPAHRTFPIARPWRYAFAAAAALAVIAIVTFKSGSSNAFAHVMQQIRNLTGCTFTLKTTTPGLPAMIMKMAIKEPGRARFDFEMPALPGSTATSIIDVNLKKLVTVIPLTKQFLVFDLTGDTKASHQAETANYFEDLRQIPDSGAEPIGTKDIGGVQAVGFRANMDNKSYVIWADPDTHRLLVVEFQINTDKTLKGEMYDFNFDPQLDDSFFSLEPPEGYTVTQGQSLNFEGPSEEGFIKFLRKTAEDTDGNLFPPSLDMEGLRKAATSSKKTAPAPSMTELFQQNFRRSQLNTIGLVFAQQMTPENDFHYAGEGVALGEADKPICWYKPTGAQNYRVIYGDLTVRDTPTADSK